MKGTIVAVSVSERKGQKKTNIAEGRLVQQFGLEGDAHAGKWHRQVSLLAEESIDKIRAKGLDVNPGAFAENLTTRGIDLPALPVGTRLLLRSGALLEVTQIGKVCHDRCAIYQTVGDCVMPREGIFARVLAGGIVRPGDSIEVQFPIKVGILTASDKGARGEREDLSGAAIREMIATIGGVVSEYETVPDELETIRTKLVNWADSGEVDLILTTGGTGLGPRDVTPDATLMVLDRVVPGIAEAMRIASLKKTSRAMLSRAVAGTRGRTLIINLPGSEKAVRECLEEILPALRHGIETMKGEASECARQD